nr:xylulose kinase-1 [Tanacetum cinerariifolium]
MVTYLSKSDASTGFDQFMDFLNAQVIQYALMVNPIIYVSCIKQFWVSATIKKVNDMVKLRALIDGKRVVVTEDIIRQALHLDDADGVECLLNEEIFIELARMGYEKPPPKLTFYKAFFSAYRKFCNSYSCSMFPQLEQDKISQALDILKLKTRVKKLEKQRRSKSSGLKRLRKVGTSQKVESLNENVVDVDTKVDMNADIKERIIQEEVNAAEPTVFDDEKVTMTMAQTLIKMKAKKAILLDEQMAKRLHDEEVEQAAAKEKHDIFMLIEKDYPLSDAVMILMLSAKLQVDEDYEMARDLVMKIFMESNKPKRRSLDTSSK